jgi:outer membrane protein assembly factor BamB
MYSVAVILLGGGLVTVQLAGSGGTPTGHNRARSNAPTSVPHIPVPAAARPVPLEARYLDLGAMSNLTASGTVLYGDSNGMTNEHGTELVKVDPSNGQVLDRTPLTDGPGSIVLMGPSLWTDNEPLNPGPQFGHHAELLRLDPNSLAVLLRIELPEEGVSIAASPSGLWVSTSHRLLLLNPDTGAILRSVSLPAGTVGSFVSPAPNGTLLYVDEVRTTVVGGAQQLESILTERNAVTGAIIASRKMSGNLAIFSATNDGLWVGSYSSGPQRDVVAQRLSSNDLGTKATFVRTDHVAGTNGTTASVVGGILWVVDSAGYLSCANPGNGQLLSVNSFGPTVLPTPITSIGSTVYLGTARGVAVFRPSGQCVSG